MSHDVRAGEGFWHRPPQHWKRLWIHPVLMRIYDDAGSHTVEAWKNGEVRAVRTCDGPARLEHLSISCASRYPTWDEIRDARFELLSQSKTFAMLLPPKAQYVNIHDNCFHLWECRDERETGRVIIPSVYDG